ncbi:MAG: fasciclin domain-containing protein [bacterium]|nr:fasciclin domain-containing protein [bacterium]
MLKKLITAVLFTLLAVMTVFAQSTEEPPSGAPLVEASRLRTAHYVYDLTPVDVYVDGELVLEDLSHLMTSPHVELAAGEHEVAFVPAEGELDDALLPAQTVTLEGGKDYVLALIGQADDESVTPLLIDETEAVASVRDEAVEASYAILIHGISDGPAIDFSLDGEVLHEDIAFGEYRVIPVTVGPHDIVVTFADDPESVLFENRGETPPSADLLLLTVMVGSYPDALDVTGAVSRLPEENLLTLLATYTEEANGYSFNTLLELIDLAGLTEALSQESRLTLFAPTDAAFAALPQADLEALREDPDALADLLRGHVVEDLFITPGIEDGAELETLSGGVITVSVEDDQIRLNDSAAIVAGGFPAVVNGNLIVIDTVLTPTD